jgi:hypothetical protein
MEASVDYEEVLKQIFDERWERLPLLKCFGFSEVYAGLQ